MARFRTSSKRSPEVPAADLKTRYVGHCPVCQGEFKLFGDEIKTRTMVHHGYRRPGHGSIVGDCFAVGYEPYEVSTKGCEDYRRMVINERGVLEDFLDRLQSGKVRAITIEKYRGFHANPQYEDVTLRADSEDAAERAQFAEALRHKITFTESQIRNCDSEIARMKGLIEAWVLKPILTFEEAANIQNEKTRAEREARKAERAAKNEAKRIKRAALDAKIQARKEERAALIAKYKALFEQLASGLESARDRKQCARSHWVDMHKALNKKAYLHFYNSVLECDDALVSLDLAKKVVRDGRPWTQYAYADGTLYNFDA